MENIILAVLSPVLTYAAVWLATLVKKGLPEVFVTSVMVPLVAGLVTIVAGWIIPDAPWYITMVPALAGTFLKEFLSNLKTAIAALWRGEPVPRMTVHRNGVV